jgi:adenylate cyclase class IV
LTQVEFELKANLKNVTQIERLIGKGKPVGEPVTQLDIYYDTAERILYCAGAFLRVRNGRSIELKATPSSAGTTHLWCNELSVPLDGSPDEFEKIGVALTSYMGGGNSPCRNLKELIAAFNLEEFVEVSKQRIIYRLEGAELGIDSVKNLGLFVELEIHDSTMREHYLQLARDAGLVHLPVGYVELILRETEPATYRKGRYLLSEDRMVGLPPKLGTE